MICGCAAWSHVDAGDPTGVGILFFVFTAQADSRDGRIARRHLEWWPADRLPTADLVEDLPICSRRRSGHASRRAAVLRRVSL